MMAAEEAGECRGALQSHAEADRRDRFTRAQQQRLGPLQALPGEVLVRRHAEQLPEEAQEVVASQAGGGGHVVEGERLKNFERPARREFQDARGHDSSSSP